jgi:hypothetical protein
MRNAPGGVMARNLIVLRCGRASLHWHWLDVATRNWDIVLCPYQDIDARDLESHLVVGQKWSGLYRFLSEFRGWRDYDYICLPDDDIAADGATWNLFFDRCRTYKIALAAPALTQDSYCSHPMTIQNTSFRARSTTFVEVMNPCFSRDFLEAALPTFALSRSGTGFGLDYLWCAMLSYRNIWIIDETAVHHTRPIGSARDPVSRSLAKYDLIFIKGFGVPFTGYTLAGIDNDGHLVHSHEPDFEKRFRDGYASLEQRYPDLWQMDDFRTSQPRPDVNPVALDRLRRSLAHIKAPDRTISRGRPCTTSSLSEWSWSEQPDLEATGANDGLLNGLCGFHTDLEVNPWWQVDLGAAHDITSVFIYNRLDHTARCVDLDIRLSLDNRTWITAWSKRDGRPFGGLDGSPFQAGFNPPVQGRFVRVQLSGYAYLHLDQVEIFGNPVATAGCDGSTAPSQVTGDQSDQTDAFVADSVVILEQILSDPRGRFLLERAIEKAIPKATTTDDISAAFGLNKVSNDGADLSKVERLAAAIDSSNYLNHKMSQCKRYGDAQQLLAAGMQHRSVPNGLVLEFGVYSGNSINHLASLEAGRVVGFDSFEGLPEEWRPDMPKSAFKLEKVPKVAPNVELVVGWFDETLPKFLASNAGPAAFIHVDCDLYSSTATVFHYLRDRIVSGTVIIFDEYFNYVGWRNHEYKAFAEFVADVGLIYRYIGAVPAHQQVGVVIC